MTFLKLFIFKLIVLVGVPFTPPAVIRVAKICWQDPHQIFLILHHEEQTFLKENTFYPTISVCSTKNNVYLRNQTLSLIHFNTNYQSSFLELTFKIWEIQFCENKKVNAQKSEMNKN